MPQPLGRQAPPVSVCSDGGAAWRLYQAAVAAAGSGVLLFWLAQHATAASNSPPAFSAGWAFLCAGCGAGLVGWLRWRRAVQPPRTLAWDGRVWTLDGQAVDLQPMLDLQRWLLLRAHGPARRPQWLAMSGHHASPAAWHGLRAARYSRAPSPSPPPAGGPPA